MGVTQLAVTTETDFGVDTPLTVEVEPPVLLPEVPVELVPPESVEPLPAVVEPPPQPTNRLTSAIDNARCDHALNDIQHSHTLTMQRSTRRASAMCGISMERVLCT